MAINIFKKDEKDAAAEKKTAVSDSNKTKKTPQEAQKSAPKHGITEDAARILRGAHVTEKAARLVQDGNKYVFKVAPHATKIEIAKAIEGSYKVKVTGVNIVNIPQKSHRRGRGIMVKAGYRKAIVSVKKGQTIEVLPK